MQYQVANSITESTYKVLLFRGYLRWHEKKQELTIKLCPKKLCSILTHNK